MQNLNQFSMTPEVGMIAFSPYSGTTTARVKPGIVDGLVAGQAVKTVASTTKLTVDKAGLTERFRGVVAYNVIDGLPKTSGLVELATEGFIVFMKAGGIIPAGSKVEITANAGEVIVSAGTNTVLGLADTGADVAGDFIKILITAPYTVA